MRGNRKYLVFIIGIGLLIVWFVIRSNSVDFNNLSVSQLAAAGYYVYILPEQVQESLNWSRTIRMHSYDYHCNKGASVEDTWNPIWIDYSSPDGASGILIRMSPHDALYDWRNAEPIDLLSPYNTYYDSYTNGYIRFVDDFGLDVISSSSRDVELLPLITQLIRVGYEGDVNPWEASCR